MKGFIEVTEDGRKVLINVNKIVSIMQQGAVTCIALDVSGKHQGFLDAKESYEEIKNLIVEATK